MAGWSGVVAVWWGIVWAPLSGDAGRGPRAADTHLPPRRCCLTPRQGWSIQQQVGIVLGLAGQAGISSTLPQTEFDVVPAPAPVPIESRLLPPCSCITLALAIGRSEAHGQHAALALATSGHHSLSCSSLPPARAPPPF